MRVPDRVMALADALDDQLACPSEGSGKAAALRRAGTGVKASGRLRRARAHARGRGGDAAGGTRGAPPATPRPAVQRHEVEASAAELATVVHLMKCLRVPSRELHEVERHDVVVLTRQPLVALVGQMWRQLEQLCVMPGVLAK